MGVVRPAPHAGRRAQAPLAGVRSNFIVGFPGESEEDLEILCDFLEAARLEGNAESRPWGFRGPSPDDRWNERPIITSEQRAAFLAAVAAATIVETQRMLETPGRVPRADPGANASTDSASSLNEHERATVARRSIRRALVELGYLTTRRTATSSTKPKELMTGN